MFKNKPLIMIIIFALISLVGCAEKVDTDVKSVNGGKEVDSTPVEKRDRDAGKDGAEGGK